jgi:hypothetical protein
MKRSIAGTFIAAALAASALPAEASTAVFVNIAPPALRHEVVPAPRVGYVWAPGYWDWGHGRYRWVAGHWNSHRPGYHYAPVRWVHRGGRYYRSGGWRDSDRDGVPNRYDNAPLDPYYR